MIRFIDIRGQGTGECFAFWDTVTDGFVSINSECAWSSWDDFAEIAEGVIDLERFRGLCPDWVFDGGKYWKVVHDGSSLGMLQSPDGRIFRIQELGVGGKQWGNAEDNDDLCELFVAGLLLMGQSSSTE